MAIVKVIFQEGTESFGDLFLFVDVTNEHVCHFKPAQRVILISNPAGGQPRNG